MVNHMYDVPADERRRSTWVMNQEWFDECAKIGWNGWQPAGLATMFALPVQLTDDGGVPHLVASDG